MSSTSTIFIAPAIVALASGALRAEGFEPELSFVAVRSGPAAQTFYGGEAAILEFAVSIGWSLDDSAIGMSSFRLEASGSRGTLSRNGGDWVNTFTATIGGQWHGKRGAKGLLFDLGLGADGVERYHSGLPANSRLGLVLTMGLFYEFHPMRWFSAAPGIFGTVDYSPGCLTPNPFGGPCHDETTASAGIGLRIALSR